MHLRLRHERFGSSSNPALNGHLHYAAPADIDKPLNEAAADKIRPFLTFSKNFALYSDYGAEYNNRRSKSISYMPAVASTFGRLHCEILRILFLQAHRETHRFFLQVQELRLRSKPGPLPPRCFYSQLKYKVGNILAKATSPTYKP
jgi:hypothetical protein